MWHTNCGDRTLDGAEVRLFAEALWDFVQELELAEGDYNVGLDVFDRLTYGQKVSLLSIIGDGLLKLDVPMRKLTAVVEGAIAAVFDHLKIAVIILNHLLWYAIALLSKPSINSMPLVSKSSVSAKAVVQT